MSDRVRLAIVGLGAVARAVHLPILKRRSDLFEIAGVFDLSPIASAHVGDRFGVEAQFDDLETMLDTTEPDALAVLNSGSHTEAILAGLARDLPVFCEKPVAYTMREAEEIINQLDGREAMLMVGYMKAYDPAVVAAEKLVAGRRARSVEVVVLHPSTQSQLATSELEPEPVVVPQEVMSRLRGLSRELQREALGGAAEELGDVYSTVLMGSVVHDLAVMRSLGVVVAHVDHAERWPAKSLDTSVAVSARTTDDVRISIRWHLLPGYPSYREEVRWHDETGSIELIFPSPYLLRAPTELRSSVALDGGADHRLVRSNVEAFEEELLAFHTMVTDAVPPINGIAEGLQDIRTCQRIAARLAERERLDLGGEAAELERRDRGDIEPITA